MAKTPARVPRPNSGARKVFLYLLFSLAMSGAAVAAPSPAPSSAADGSFLIVSDIHFNPMADPTLVADLAAAEPSQWEAILKRSKSTAFSQYGEDTNWWLLQSSLQQMQINLPHPAFIMMNGDIFAHQFPQTYRKITGSSDRESYRKFVLKTVEFLMLEFRQHFKDPEILLTPGNNDEECGNYSIEAGGRFLHDTADLVRKLARGDDNTRGAWEQLGSYDVANPAIAGARIISLNTVFWSNKYRPARFSEGCAPTTSTAADDLFAWLEARLSQAQQAHEKVWLMFHIPPGIDSYATVTRYQQLLTGKNVTPPTEQLCTSAIVPLWAPERTARFDALLAKYQSTVAAVFAGHIHVDDFRILDGSGSQRPFVLITPAISPVYNQNPSFRTVEFAKDGSLVNQSVYFLTNLEYASSTTKGVWRREYKFSEQWGASRINADTLAAVYEKVRENEADRGAWLTLYNVSSSAVRLPPDSTPGLYCASEALDPQAYSQCYCKSVVNTRQPEPHP